MTRLLPAALGGVLLASAPAAAREVPYYVAPGVTGSAVFGQHDALGFGVELTVGRVPWPLGFAGLFQYDWLDDGSTRRAVGGQLLGPFFGIEIAWSQRDDGARKSDGLQLAPFGTLGFVYLSGRVVLTSGYHGNEYGAVLGLKLPIPTGNLPVSFGHGRPLRDLDGQPRLGAVRLLPGAAVAVPGLDPATRRAIGAAWLADARVEHASVATFLQLAGWLTALGAPAALVQAARTAAADEARHAQVCFALAERYLGVRCVAPPLPIPPDPPPSLARLAVDSLIEGVFGEGVAARQAELTLARTHDPLARAALDAIAREEAEHARLAQAIITWSRMRAPQAVDAALASARLPRAATLRADQGRAGRAHGRASLAIQRHAFGVTRARLAAA